MNINANNGMKEEEKVNKIKLNYKKRRRQKLDKNNSFFSSNKRAPTGWKEKRRR